jgi:hypothetical protein
MKMLQRRLDGYSMVIWSLTHIMHCEGVFLLSWDYLGALLGWQHLYLKCVRRTLFYSVQGSLCVQMMKNYPTQFFAVFRNLVWL